MDQPALVIVGMTGWLLLAAYAFVCDCRAGHPLGACFAALIHLIVVIDVWAVVPAALHASAHPRVEFAWGAAIPPYLFLIFRWFRPAKWQTKKQSPP